ncbi:MAG TPA: glycosyltransferase, partial [Terriglobia bacterium]|nr:glycosyltransferase [Terriglobia bacterium]
MDALTIHHPGTPGRALSVSANTVADENEIVHSGTRGPRILIAAGGTGGHIFPALAVAQELKWGSSVRTGSEIAAPEIEFL